MDLVAIFTGLLFAATVALWWATRQLVKGSEDTARRQLRAYITVTEASFTVEGNELKITVTLHNNGQTPAKKYRGYVGGTLLPVNFKGTLPEATYEGQGYGPLGAGSRTFLYTRVPLAAGEEAQIAQGTKAIYLVGKVEYVDIFDTTQTLDFVMVDDKLSRPMFRHWEDLSRMT